MHIFPNESSLGLLQGALECSLRTGGTTHDFYHYPARFSPEIARCVLQTFSQAGDWVLDPFMGGGTAVVEGLMLGRRMIGLDVNSLAHFVSRVRTHPLSRADECSIQRWAKAIASSALIGSSDLPTNRATSVRNLPKEIQEFMTVALTSAAKLFPRRQAFARCALLRLGQRALDCRSDSPKARKLGWRLAASIDDMLDGLADFVLVCPPSAQQF